jgi:hypothetical protein
MRMLARGLTEPMAQASGIAVQGDIFKKDIKIAL